jgi:acetyl-CoA carboxylase biotin carboxyl carrier protein
LVISFSIEVRLSKKKVTPPAAKSTPGASVTGPMDVGLLEQIVAFMTKHDLNTVDVRDGDRRVVLKRGAVYAAPASAPAAPHAPAPVERPAAGTAIPPAPPAADDNAGLVPIKSPMVGTFYSAPSPDAKPFVTVGSAVDDETDVCMVEAMKTFSNIKAETRGTIAKVLVTNGQTVQFGTPLFLVKP